MELKKQTHPFGPIYDQQSKILILGSFPSVKSREYSFYYAHKQNRFWQVLQSITNYPNPIETNEEKRAMLTLHNIALWDTIKSCEIKGSSDASIKNVKTNDLSLILKKTFIKKIYCHGNTSFHLYQKYVEKEVGLKAIKLPSTSPANAAWSLERLIEAWRREIIPYL